MLHRVLVHTASYVYLMENHYDNLVSNRSDYRAQSTAAYLIGHQNRQDSNWSANPCRVTGSPPGTIGRRGLRGHSNVAVEYTRNKLHILMFI